MTIAHWFIYALAVWRVSSLLVGEKGPWNIFMKLREWAGILHDERGMAYHFPDGFFAGVLSCTWCSSIWISFFWTIAWLISPEWALRLAVPFAFSAGAIILDVFIKRNSQ